MASSTTFSEIQPSVVARDLPSGRRLVIRSSGGAETVEIQSQSRKIEVSILMTGEGTVIRASADRLEVESADEVAVDCSRFEVRANAMDLQASGLIRLDGELIYLNCDGPETAHEEDPGT